MKDFFKSRNLIIGIITLIIGVVAALGIAGILNFQSTTVNGNVVSFILNPEGKVEGAILDTGDQIKFGAQTGEIVTAQINIGDALSATGYAGSKSDYGREIRAESLQISDQTITVVNAKPRWHRGWRKDQSNSLKRECPLRSRGEKPEPRDKENIENTVLPAPDKETAKTNSNVKLVIVGSEGEARGLILADGTQIDLPKEVKKAELTFSEATVVDVEGEAAKGEFGTFIRPAILTIDNQTFSFNR